MDYSKKLSLGKEVSFVIYIIDDYKGEAASDFSYKIFFPYNPKAVLHKPSGLEIFCKLPYREYPVDINSEVYFDEKIVIDYNISNNGVLVKYIFLKPKPSYLFGYGATLLRVCVVDSKKNPINKVLIKAEGLSSMYKRGKIAKASVEKGDTDFYLTSVTGKVFIGEQYIIDRGSQQEEICTVLEQLEGLKHYKLQEPFANAHDRGSELIPLVQTYTDESGEAVVYFRSLPAKQVDIKLTLYFGEKSITKEVNIEEGKTTYLGKIEL